MDTPRAFGKLMRKEMQMHGAWLPITNTFETGDYGIFSGGVFHKLGNISSYGVEFDTGDGAPADLNVMSKGTRLSRVAGDGKVDKFPAGDIEAKLLIEFGSAESFLLKARLTSEEIADLENTATQLREIEEWHRDYKVVSTTYTAEDCLIVSSISDESKVEVSGSASALADLEDLGKADAELKFEAAKEIGLRLLGETGIIGLRLFKLGWLGGTKIVRNDQPKNNVVQVENWDEDVEDDV